MKLIDIEEIEQFLTDADRRIRAATGRRFSVDSFFAINFVQSGVYVKVGPDSSTSPVRAIRKEQSVAQFDWSKTKAEIAAWLDEIETHRAPTHEEIGLTLGIVEPAPAHAIAAE